ncbi:hypothetical protein [Shuttleworthella satelles]|uniref:Uncharacterized protein n=1 Tax=Shuttleworthella satelles DSM 14600 TaxID=626523 RepID=C4GAR2_9FIRM|nr:hypothetical protein [Shuttleworthia satelles]EEP28205.1 hypothetical protein GCWU000342_01013 [Shuttleworthia satelles DSM 14600]
MIEPAILVALASLIGTVVFGILTAVHNNGGDVREEIEKARLEAARGAKIETALQNIQKDTTEIKEDQKAFRSTVADISNRLLTVEQSAKSAHHRIDEIVHKDRREEKENDNA